MDRAEMKAKVIQFIAQKLRIWISSTISEASKFEELGLDSMDTIQLLFDAEDTFGVNFEGEEAKGFTCVGDIISYIEKHQVSAPTLEE